MKRLIICVFAVALCLGMLPVSAVSTSAKATALINGHTGEIIFSQNADTRLPMASTTKIMTALLLAECNTPEKTIVTTKEMVTVEGSSMGLLAGDTVTYNDLLYGMLLASGNDAANTTAISVAGSVERFVEMMNDRARKMGLRNTSFVTPSGLDAAEHYTTAYELALIAKEALNNDAFLAAASSRTATLCYGNPPYKRTLTNHNRLLASYKGLIGVKTGFTKKSGRCLVTAAERDGKRVIAVTLNDPNDWADHRALLDFGLEKIKAIECIPPADTYTVNVAGGDSAAVVCRVNTVKIGVCTDKEIVTKVSLPKIVFAPVKKGSIVGSVDYYIGDTLIGGSDIIADNTVNVQKNSLISDFLGCLCNILSSI